jgi:predicted ATPase
LGNRLAALIDDANAIAIEKDDKHETLTLEVTGRNGTTYPARSLSDGTLRFLALAVMEIDSDTQGVVCLEEPENGIHPERIPAMLRLLRDIAADPEEEVDETNPLRQVIVNTHSPAVVLQVPPESLLFADARQDVSDRGAYLKTVFHPLPNTWRTRPPANEEPLALGKLLAYLKPVVQSDEVRAYEQRVVDTRYVQDLLKF